MSVLSTIQLAAYKFFYGFAPKRDALALALNLDFSVNNPYSVNLSEQVSQDIIEFAQTLFIDNSSNTSTLTVECGTSKQVVSIPGGYQAYMPVICPNAPHFKFTTTGTPIIPVQILNVPLPPMVWPASQQQNQVIPGGATILDFSANPPSLYSNLVATIPANTQRANVEVQNQDANAVQVVLQDANGNNQSIFLLAPGAGANNQGASWNDPYFKGIVKVYAQESSAQVMAREC